MRLVDGALAAPLLLFAFAANGCKNPMARIEGLRDALVSDDAERIRKATADYPSCNDQPLAVVPPGKPGIYDAGCLSDIANALGSKQGFSPSPPDHAAAATAALVLLRDGRGDWLAHPDTWLNDVKNGKGTGHDALRLAIARKMADAAPAVGRPIDDDGTATAAMKVIVGAIPGACPTYWLLGSGAPAPIPPEFSAAHSACVQRDLSRREGPGASYGEGNLRATEGALALWRETERALRLGLSNTAPGPKAVLERKLTIIEGATRKIETKKLPPASVAVLNYMGEIHAEAGITILNPIDAGADGGGSGDASAPADASVP